MTRADGDYDDTLSRVLRSTLDPVEPAGDGLAKIQRRIAEPWLKRRVSLFRAELAALAWLIFVRCEPLLTKVKGTASPAPRGATARASSGRHSLRNTRPRRSAGPATTWLRPTLAVGGAVVIVVVGVFALTQVREALISPAGNGINNSPAPGHSQGPTGHHHSAGTGLGQGSQSQRPTAGQSPSHQAASKAAVQTPAQSSPTVPPTSPPSSSPSPSMSPSSSPTSTPTISPTTSTPSQSPTTSTGGGTSPNPQPTPAG